MAYIDTKALAAIDPRAFQRTDPFPWINPAGFLSADGFARLVANLPDVSRFTSAIDYTRQRKYGQQNHDRYVLEYLDGMELPAPWQEFIDELRGDYTIRLGTGQGFSLSPFHLTSAQLMALPLLALGIWLLWRARRAVALPPATPARAG